jgi:hypothetical protein
LLTRHTEFSLPKVYNKHRSPYPPNAVYCGRGSPYGNPFVIGRDGDRDEVCDKFEREILPTLDVTALRGKNLLCFCAPKRCHCDAILRKANEE